MKPKQTTTIQSVYGLVDPRTFMIRYIGITNSGTRLSHHITRNKGKRRGSKAKTVWLQNLIDLGLEPTIVVLQTVVDRQQALVARQNWINQGYATGWELLNNQRYETEQVGPVQTLKRSQKYENILLSRLSG